MASPICQAAETPKGWLDSDKSIAEKRDNAIRKEVDNYEKLSLPLPPEGERYKIASEVGTSQSMRVELVQSDCRTTQADKPAEKPADTQADKQADKPEVKSRSCVIEEAVTGAKCDPATTRDTSTLGASVSERHSL